MSGTFGAPDEFSPPSPPESPAATVPEPPASEVATSEATVPEVEAPALESDAAMAESVAADSSEPPTAEAPPEATVAAPAPALAPLPQPAAPVPRPPQRPPDAARCHRGLRPPVLEVWRYLSRPELLARWLGIVDLELVVGGDFSLHAWNGDIVRGRVLKADPPSTLALAWKPQATGAESRVTIQLQGDGPGSRISVRHEGLTSEPERRQARRLWREVLTALRTALHEDADAHEWGATLPISIRTPLFRSSGDLWPLLSTAQGLAKWLGHVDRFDGAPEGLFRFTSRVQGRDVAEEGSIEQMADQNRIILGWEWVGESWGGRTKLEMTLEPDPSGAALLLLHSGFDKIAPAQAAIARRHYAASWPRVVANLRRLVAPIHA